MSSNGANNKSAFTLIELSIVIIVIGLLVAGVVGGKSLIAASEKSAFKSKIKGFDTAKNENVSPETMIARVKTADSPIGDIAKPVLWLETTLADSFVNGAKTGFLNHDDSVNNWYNLEICAIFKDRRL